jgi:hypothetical protein
MKFLLTAYTLFALVSIQSACAGENTMAAIHGKVTDFSGKPIDGADIVLQNDKYKTLYSTKSDSVGNYSFTVKKGHYNSLFVCKDWKVHNLEYWAWNVIVDSDLEINPRFHGLEVYALNAFAIPGVPLPMQIYFRPMSLKRLELAGGMEKVMTGEFIDIAPKLKKTDIQVTINGEALDVLEINPIKEYVSEKQKIAAYLIQTGLPKKSDQPIWRICVTLKDPETNEQGEACLFWEKPRARDFSAKARS